MLETELRIQLLADGRIALIQDAESVRQWCATHGKYFDIVMLEPDSSGSMSLMPARSADADVSEHQRMFNFFSGRGAW